MPLAPGTRLGPYEIVAPLGAGGMGEVYRARDGRLKREVALKILPAEVASEPGRRQRFEQEARAVAALNHPNIVAIYDVGDENGLLYIVTELVPGEPLRGLKPGLRKAVDFAVQIAGGVGAAHSAGVVHRDLKPENILVTADGRIKILDFGLAKVSAPQSPEHATQTMAETDPGKVMGTIGYMSPEQVRGQPADHRSDIFNIGLILYELLTGARAFQAETAAETMTAILKEDTPELPDSVPAGVRQVVDHCLEKRPENRFQSAQDLSFALTAMSQSGAHTGQAPIVPPSPAWRRWILWAVAALILLLALAIGARIWLRPAPPSLVWTATYLGGTEVALSPRPSPDGRTVAFIALVGEFLQLGILRPETGDRVILTHNEQNGYIQRISWSPDGTRIFYDRWTDVPRGIYSVPALGGDERAVLEDAELSDTLADGTLLVGRFNPQHQRQLFRYWPETGKLQAYPIEIAQLSGAPAIGIADGKSAIAAGMLIGPGRESSSHVFEVNLSSGTARKLATGLAADAAIETIAATRDGQSVLIAAVNSGGAGGRVLEVPRNSRGPVRTLFPITAMTGFMDGGPDGSIYMDQWVRPMEILRYSTQGGRSEIMATFPISGGDGLAVLPDGRVVVPQRAGGRRRLMVVGAGKDPAPLVATDEETLLPVAPAGPGEAVFLFGSPPHQAIGIATVSNGRVTRRIEFNRGAITSLASSPDGKTLYFAADGAIWAVDASGGEPRMIRAGNAVAVDPGGQYLLIELFGTPRIRLMRVPLNGGAEQEIPQTGPQRPANVIGPNAVGKDGRIAMPFGSASWFWPAGVIDPASGKFTQVNLDHITDHHLVGWAPDGRLISVGLGLQSTMWRFSPEGR